MSTSVNWPLIGGTSYSVPAAGEVNWAALSDFLVALGNGAQGTASQKIAIREAVTSPVTVASTTDCVVISNLTVPGAVAFNLPAGVIGQYFMIVDGKGDANSNNITVTPNGAETINGAATYTITTNRGAVVLAFRGTNWSVVAEFSNFSAGSIPRSSIAAGTPNEVVINDGGGLLSSEPQLATSRGGTGVNSTATFPASGDVITRTSTDTGANRLTNKDLDDDSVKFVDSGDVTKAVEFEVSGSTTGTTTTLATTSTVGRNIILPDANTTLVGRDTSDLGANRLTNKDFDASLTQFVDPTDTTKTVKFDASAATAGADLTLASVATVDSTITLPDATDTLVGRITSDTGANRLQNKELDDATVAFVDDADTTKKLKFQVSGVTTATTRTLTAPDANTTIVGTDAVQVITNKDIDGGVASNASRLTLPKDTYTNLLALTRKEGTLLYATDLDTVFYDDGVNLLPVGSGSGQGELNAISNPSASTNTSGWVVSGTATVTRITSGSPLDPVISTAFELDGGAANDDVDVDFTLPVGLENTKLKLEWFQSPEAGYVLGDWEVQLWNQAETLQYPLSTDQAGTTDIPNLTGKFTAYFDSDGTNTLRVKYIRKVGALYLRVTNVIVGPGIQPQGAVVTDWQVYTPTLSGVGTATNVNFKYRRVGSGLEISGRFTAGTPSGVASAEISLPSGLNIDTTGLAGNLSAFGDWHQLFGGGSNIFSSTSSGVCMYSGGGTQVVRLAYQMSGNIYTVDVANAFIAASNVIDIPSLFIPVAEWSGNGVVQLAENAVEYASNFDTADANDTTSFAYGPAGSLVPTINSSVTTANRSKRVQFNSPILPTDQLQIELLLDTGAGTLKWVRVEESADYIGAIPLETTARYGIGLLPVAASTSQIDVAFFRGGRTLPNTYASNGGNYPSVASDRWRVRKVSQNGALGFQEATANGTGLAGPAGSYTPTLTATTNISSVTLIGAHYSRIGNIVNVSVQASVTTSAAAPSDLTISLPISSTLGAANVSGSCGWSSATSTGGGWVEANVTVVEARFYVTNNAAGVFGCNFTYEIL